MSKNFTMAKAEEVLREIEEYRDLYEEAPHRLLLDWS